MIHASILWQPWSVQLRWVKNQYNAIRKISFPKYNRLGCVLNRSYRLRLKTLNKNSRTWELIDGPISKSHGFVSIWSCLADGLVKSKQCKQILRDISFPMCCGSVCELSRFNKLSLKRWTRTTGHVNRIVYQYRLLLGFSIGIACFVDRLVKSKKHNANPERYFIPDELRVGLWAQ